MEQKKYKENNGGKSGGVAASHLYPQEKEKLRRSIKRQLNQAVQALNRSDYGRAIEGFWAVAPQIEKLYNINSKQQIKQTHIQDLLPKGYKFLFSLNSHTKYAFETMWRDLDANHGIEQVLDRKDQSNVDRQGRIIPTVTQKYTALDKSARVKANIDKRDRQRIALAYAFVVGLSMNNVYFDEYELNGSKRNKCYQIFQGGYGNLAVDRLESLSSEDVDNEFNDFIKSRDVTYLETVAAEVMAARLGIETFKTRKQKALFMLGQGLRLLFALACAFTTMIAIAAVLSAWGFALPVAASAGLAVFVFTAVANQVVGSGIPKLMVDLFGHETFLKALRHYMDPQGKLKRYKQADQKIVLAFIFSSSVGIMMGALTWGFIHMIPQLTLLAPYASTLHAVGFLFGPLGIFLGIGAGTVMTLLMLGAMKSFFKMKSPWDIFEGAKAHFSGRLFNPNHPNNVQKSAVKLRAQQGITLFLIFVLLPLTILGMVATLFSGFLSFHMVLAGFLPFAPLAWGIAGLVCLGLAFGGQVTFVTKTAVISCETVGEWIVNSPITTMQVLLLVGAALLFGLGALSTPFGLFAFTVLAAAFIGSTAYVAFEWLSNVMSNRNKDSYQNKGILNELAESQADSLVLKLFIGICRIGNSVGNGALAIPALIENFGHIIALFSGAGAAYMSFAAVAAGSMGGNEQVERTSLLGASARIVTAKNDELTMTNNGVEWRYGKNGSEDPLQNEKKYKKFRQKHEDYSSDENFERSLFTRLGGRKATDNVVIQSGAYGAQSFK